MSHKLQVEIDVAGAKLTPIDVVVPESVATELETALRLVPGEIQGGNADELDIPEEIDVPVNVWFIHTRIHEGATVKVRILDIAEG